jgi:hypothetical protein
MAASLDKRCDADYNSAVLILLDEGCLGQSLKGSMEIKNVDIGGSCCSFLLAGCNEGGTSIGIKLHK